MTNVRFENAHEEKWASSALKMTYDYFNWMNDQIQCACGISISEIVGSSLEKYIVTAANQICPNDDQHAKFYLLVIENTPVSMGGWRTLPSGDAEAVRIYTTPAYRQMGYGKLMLNRVISDCHQRGFAKLKLDTAIFMKEAHALYRTLGFIDCPAYEGAEPPTQLIPHWLYMELNLTRAKAPGGDSTTTE